jgi:hypothetical protein
MEELQQPRRTVLASSREDGNVLAVDGYESIEGVRRFLLRTEYMRPSIAVDS